MLEKILVPSDLSDESNSVIPYAVTLAQAFQSKLYLLHVMDPASLKGPENLLDFPRLTKMFALEATAPDLPPLKKSVPVAKMYMYKKDRAEAIVLGCAAERWLTSRANPRSVTRAKWGVGILIASALAVWPVMWFVVEPTEAARQENESAGRTIAHEGQAGRPILFP